MLKDYLYTLQQISDTSAHIRLLPDSPIYEAHFKGMPVTPGACIIQMACELVGASVGKVLDVEEASDIRFVHPVLPTEITELEFQYSRPFPAEQPDVWSVHILSGETLCARMKLTLKP
jgi:3-hydroxyacyl-[acyl-carrier-protein] dehydratase